MKKYLPILLTSLSLITMVPPIPFDKEPEPKQSHLLQWGLNGYQAAHAQLAQQAESHEDVTDALPLEFPKK